MLDHFKINSKVMTGIAKHVIEKSIRKSTGFDTEIGLNSFEFSVNDDGTVSVNLDISGKMKQEDFKKLLFNGIR